jgi:hypothetical protein
VDATQDTNWAALSPAEQLNYFSHVGTRKLYLLVFQALRHDFDCYWRWPTEGLRVYEVEWITSFRQRIESIEPFADSESKRDTKEEAAEFWMMVKEATVMVHEFELAAYIHDCRFEIRTTNTPQTTILRRMFGYEFVPEYDWPPTQETVEQRRSAARAAIRANRTALLREILGPTQEPIVLSTEWRTDTVLLLARTMYKSREFSAMPILADALQDAGCDNTDILNHCRDTSQVHVRGCWVVDLVLGKT